MTRRRVNLRNEDLTIQLRPVLDRKNKSWTGQIEMFILESPKSSLPKRDRDELYRLCTMMCSVIPMMEQDPDLMADIDEFAKSYTKQLFPQKELTVVGENGNVVTLDFSKTDTKGNA